MFFLFSITFFIKCGYHFLLNEIEQIVKNKNKKEKNKNNNNKNKITNRTNTNQSNKKNKKKIQKN